MEPPQREVVSTPPPRLKVVSHARTRLFHTISLESIEMVPKLFNFFTGFFSNKSSGGKSNHRHIAFQPLCLLFGAF